MWQHVDRVALTEGSCRKHVLPNLRMRAALINSPKWVWSKHTRAAQLARARLLQPVTEANSLERTEPAWRWSTAEIGRREYSRSCSYFYYRAAGCMKMGKHKFTDEIAQRKRNLHSKNRCVFERATVLQANNTHVTHVGMKACLSIHNW